MVYSVKLKKATVMKVKVGNTQIGKVYLSPSGNFLGNLLSPDNDRAIENFFLFYDVPKEVAPFLREVLECDSEFREFFFWQLSCNPMQEVIIELEDIEQA